MDTCFRRYDHLYKPPDDVLVCAAALGLASAKLASEIHDNLPANKRWPGTKVRYSAKMVAAPAEQ